MMLEASLPGTHLAQQREVCRGYWYSNDKVIPEEWVVSMAQQLWEELPEVEQETCDSSVLTTPTSTSVLFLFTVKPIKNEWVEYDCNFIYRKLFWLV